MSGIFINFAKIMDKGRIILFPSLLAQRPVGDVLPRLNIELLRTVRYFVVEELRSARRFIRACGSDIDIDSLHFEVLNEHTAPAEVAAMLAPALEGHDIGIISEAGCPAVADPGADLVAVAQSHGLEVLPLVGPSSILMSLMASGFNGQSFAFTGYLPIDARARAARLREMADAIRRRKQTQIFIETPYRNRRLVSELKETLPGDMLLCVALDITGASQRIVTKPLNKWQADELPKEKVPAIFLLYS